MKITLPKAMRGFQFTRLTSFEMNDFDVDRLLPSLFYLSVSGGRGRTTGHNDPEAIDRYLDSLAAHPQMANFSDPTGRRLLERWVRHSIFEISRAGQSRTSEKIDYLQPLTLLTYKTGFPTETSQQRQVDRFLYQALCQNLSPDPKEPRQGATALARRMTEAFGEGLRIGPAPQFIAERDEAADLDLVVRLCLYTLDGFQDIPPTTRERPEGETPALPGLAAANGRLLLGYLAAYRPHLPVLVLSAGFRALINLTLFVYTLELYQATATLFETRELSATMAGQERPSVRLYVDFTGQRSGPSDELARACVERDREASGAFYPNLIAIRTLARFVERNDRWRTETAGLPTPEYLRYLVRLPESEVQIRAEYEMETLRTEALEACPAADQEDLQAFLDDVRNTPGKTTFEQLVSILAAVHQKSATSNLGRWFWSVGGLTKPFGILEGNLRGRPVWRYAMSDELLRTLVQLALIEDAGGSLRNVSIRPRLALREFLGFLETRFGILVAEPPAFRDTTTNRAVALENLEALKRRLRQMGYLEDLSDDYNAQYLRAPRQAVREVSS